MSYTQDSKITGSGQASAAAIDACIRLKGRQLAPTYAPDHTYADPPLCGPSIIRWAQQWGINSDLMTAQMIHESAGGQSAIFRAKLNVAGIGATNDNPMGGAVAYASVDDAFKAQAAHLADYAVGKGDWTSFDPRASAMSPNAFGIAPTLVGLDGRWAYPGVGYGAAIASIANELLATVPNDVSTVSNQNGATVSATDPNRPTSISGISVSLQPAADGNWDANQTTVRLFVVHDEEASTAASAVSRFQTSGQQASAHFVGDPAHGQIIQCVSLDHVAYAVGNLALNRASISMENPGFMGQPYPESVVDYCARVAAYVCQLKGIPAVWLTRDQVKAGQAGICGHQDIPNESGTGWGGNDGHMDPGATWPRAHFIALVNQYMGKATPQVVTPPTPVQPANPVRYFPETHHTLRLGFRAFWESHSDALQLFGFPISEEFTNANGTTVQWFERARFEWAPGHGFPFDVQLGLVGTEDAGTAQAANPQAFAPVAQS